MCEEESDDHEAVAKLFEINDSIHRTLERYKLIKKGDLEGASRIPQGTLGTSGAGVSRGPDNELSLIDLGGPEELSTAGPTGTSTSTEAPSAPKGNALEDDLLGLSMGDDTFGQGGGISLGSTNGFSTYTNSLAWAPTNSQQTRPGHRDRYLLWGRGPLRNHQHLLYSRSRRLRKLSLLKQTMTPSVHLAHNQPHKLVSFHQPSLHNHLNHHTVRLIRSLR